MFVAWSRRAIRTATSAATCGCGLLACGLAMLIVWQQRAHDRRRLLAMSERHLSDIGLSRADILREANKPFWRP